MGDHDTRLRIDIGGYRAKRREALSRFVTQVADEVVASGTARALEPMPSPDRKIVHDALTGRTDITTHSEGDDPNRRVVIVPVGVSAE
jgi:spoIIIJ-associated protein